MFIRYNDILDFWEYDTSATQTGAGPWLVLPVNYNQLINKPTIPSAPIWTLYTPTFVTTGAAPSIGNGQLQGIYIAIGKMCSFQIRFSPGTTTNMGTGVWIFGLPLPGATQIVGTLGASQADDVGTLSYLGVSVFHPSGVYSQMANNAQCGSTVPFIWVAGDVLGLVGTYVLA